MKLHPVTDPLALLAGLAARVPRPIVIERATGVLTVRHGRVWVTQQGEGGDRVEKDDFLLTQQEQDMIQQVCQAFHDAGKKVAAQRQRSRSLQEKWHRCKSHAADQDDGRPKVMLHQQEKPGIQRA